MTSTTRWQAFKQRLTGLAPLARIGIWLLGVLLIASAIQLGAWLIGAPLSLLDKSGGSTVLIAIALFLLLVMMALDRRTAAEYGLVADSNWARHGLGGMAAGAVFYAGYCFVGWWAGVYTLQLEQVTTLRVFKAGLAGASAIPLAVTQQIIFSGYLLGTVRQRHGRVLAIGVPAMLFATACCLSKLSTAPPLDLARLACGMGLLAVLLGILRLRMGNIALAAGVLAGCVGVRKLLGKTRLLSLDTTDPWATWLAPGGDPRQAPVLWALVGVAIGVAAYLLIRLGERQPAAGKHALDASFKRIMPFSNLLALAPLDRWITVLADARFRVGWKYLPRLLVTLVASTCNTVLALPERLLAPLLLRHDVPPPVFIVGMPRSGTTHLHNLLALDPQFRAPRNYEVFNPYGFLTGWLTTAVMAPFLTWRRPMDAVQMQVFSPQEEEFALAGMSSYSPYWGFEFPRRIQKYDRYWQATNLTASQRRRWQRQLQLFLRKITIRGRRPLLKNPANTGRVGLLKKTFHDAQFVHIYRHPHAVYRSNLHLAAEGLVVFQLQDPDPHDSYATRALDNYRSLMDRFYHDAGSLPTGDVAEVCFEALDSDPVGTIETLYQKLGWELSPAYRARLEHYLAQVAGFRKNQLPQLPLPARTAVDTAMAPYLSQWGYVATHRESAA